MRLCFYIFLCVVLTSCLKKDISESLDINFVVSDSTKSLVLEIKNNTNIDIYVPNALAILWEYRDFLKVVDLTTGELIQLSSFDEYSEIHSFNFKVSRNSKKDNGIVEVERDLFLPPFSRQKELIKNIAWEDYKRILLDNDSLVFVDFSDKDISLVEYISMSKYRYAIFLKSGESFNDYLDIESLIDSENSYMIIIDYDPLILRSDYFLTEYLQDTFFYTNKRVEKFREYRLFDSTIKDTIWVP